LGGIVFLLILMSKISLFSGFFVSLE